MRTLPFRHPLATHAAGTVLGWRRNGSPIYAIAGGNGEGEGGSGSGSGQGGSGDDGGAGQGGEGAGGQGGQQSGQGGSGTDPWFGFQWDGKVDSLPPDVAKVIKDAREDAGKARTTAKQNAANEARQELAQQIGKALGIVKDDTPADPAELTRTITTQTSRIGDLEGTVRQQAVELAIHGSAAKHQANATALLDSRAFLKSVEGLDPTADDFTTKLDEAIKAAVDSNAQLRTVPGAPRRGGGDFAGGPGTTGRPTSLGQAVAGALNAG